MRQWPRGKVILACAWAALLLGSAPGATAASKSPGAPEVRSAAALVVNGDTGQVIFERKAALVVPIASITKLMTALVVIDGQQPLDEVIKVSAEDVWKGKGAFSRLAVGTKLTRGDLLRLALM